MRVFKASTKQGQRVIGMYDRLTGHTLSDIYKSWSTYKASAYDECYNKFFNEDGHGFRVGNANSMQFTSGWTILDNYGCVEAVRVETKDNSYKVYMNI